MSSPGFRDRNHQGDFESYVQVIVGNSRIAWYGCGPGRPNNIDTNPDEVPEDKHQLVALWQEIDPGISD